MTSAAERYQGNAYLRHNPSWHSDDSPWKARQVLKMLERRACSPTSVCEVGCGAGVILRTLHDEMDPSLRFVGYDIAPAAIELAQPLTTERLSYRLADFATCRDTYDLLLLIDVIEHVETPVDFLRSIGGRAENYILHIPLDLSAEWVLRPAALLNERLNVGHLHFFNVQLAAQVLAEGGLEVVDWFYTPWNFAFSRPGSRLRRAKKRLHEIGFAARPDLYARLFHGVSMMVFARPACQPE